MSREFWGAVQSAGSMADDPEPTEDEMDKVREQPPQRLVYEGGEVVNNGPRAYLHDHYEIDAAEYRVTCADLLKNISYLTRVPLTMSLQDQLSEALAEVSRLRKENERVQYEVSQWRQLGEQLKPIIEIDNARLRDRITALTAELRAYQQAGDQNGA